jgi:L-aminopeptidase/D-esterase-like protein
MINLGKKNLITDVDGILVGNAHNKEVATGCTVITPIEGSLASADVRGGAPGTREVGALNPYNLIDSVDSIVLSGGSTWGLEAASSVANSIGGEGRGYRPSSKSKNVPMVPAAILYDLANGGDKEWLKNPPYSSLGLEAVSNLSDKIELGNFGAGYGSQAGSLKGGLGSASFVSNDGIQVGGLFAVNSYGSTVNNETGQFWAATDETENEFGGMGVPTFAPNDVLSGTAARETLPGQNTTIGVIATNVKLDSKAAKRIAIMAHSGMSRAIRPIHSPVDGDVIFVISTGTLNKELSLNDINTIGELGARVCSRSIARGIYEADSILGIKSWREVYE